MNGVRAVPRREAFAAFLRIGLFSFGGPAAQIALMHRVLVDEKRWLGERDFLNALGFCMLLPGPEAMQLSTYAGWRLHGVAGGLVAGLLFVLPGAAVILALAAGYALLAELPAVDAFFLGIKAAVLIIVIEALLKVARRALGTVRHYLVAALAFAAIFFFGAPFPAIVVAAALYGAFFMAGPVSPSTMTETARVPISKTAMTIATWLAIWWSPLIVLAAIGANPVLIDIGLFFSKLAVVTFGGAYAVLAYMAQQVVADFGWLSTGEMMDGLGLAETTPGPLILVTEFVGFMAAFRAGGMWLAVTGAAVTLWVTFTPCFLWIFAGAPYIGWISTQPRLSAALSAITAGVVGVILNLSIWFGLHVLFAEVHPLRYGPLTILQPEWLTVDWRALLLAFVSAFLLLRLHWGIVSVLSVSAGLGLLLSMAV